MSAFDRLGLTHNQKEKKTYSPQQEQTKNTFSYKWSKRDTYESDAVKNKMRTWLYERYCDNEPTKLKSWLQGERKLILDAGCGSGFSALLFFDDYLQHHDYLGVDISDSVHIAEERFKEMGYQADFLQADLQNLPIPDGEVDIIFSEGVLHHTDDTKESIKCLSKKLKSGGRFLFYVYAQKAIVREFTDDYIRQQLQSLTDEQAWTALEPLTKLGIALGELNVSINVREDIPLLGIKKGEIDIQRFFYWYICKAFYREDFTFDEMNHANFDWFRPLNCHRHTPNEIREFCVAAELNIEHMNIQPSGITVVALKQ